MSSEAYELAKKIVGLVKKNYEDPDFNDSEFSSRELLSADLPRFFEENNIFYFSYLLASSKGLINSTYLGNIVNKKSNFYVCSLHGSFDGVDFYESLVGRRPTIVRELPTLDNNGCRLLIHKDNINRFFNSTSDGDVDNYINQIINRGTSKLKPSLEEIKYFLKK